MCRNGRFSKIGSHLLFYHEKYVESNFQAAHISLSQLTLNEDIDE